MPDLTNSSMTVDEFIKSKLAVETLCFAFYTSSIVESCKTGPLLSRKSIPNEITEAKEVGEPFWNDQEPT